MTTLRHRARSQDVDGSSSLGCHGKNENP
ncbi:hypothetical protein AVEN_260928-1, partial [Araneus ventricosus]